MVDSSAKPHSPVVIGARAAFSYGAGHWFEGPLVSWAIANWRELVSFSVTG
jgi:hypothetical protein